MAFQDRTKQQVVDGSPLLPTFKSTTSSGEEVPSVIVDNSALPAGAATSAKQDALAALIGEVQAAPTANTLLARLKDLLTGIVLAAGTAVIGKVGLSSIDNPALPCVTGGASAKVAYDGSVQSGAITATVVRVVSSTDCHIAFGANPTAVADGTCVFLPSNTPEYFRMTSGQKIAAIKDVVAGNLFITAAA